MLLIINAIGAAPLWAQNNETCRPKLYFSLDEALVITDGLKKTSSSWGAYDITDRVKDNGRALAFAQDHLKYNAYGWYSYLGSTAIFLTLYYVSFNSEKYGVPIQLGSLLLYTVGGISLTTYFQTRATRALHDALNTYNGIHVDRKISLFPRVDLKEKNAQLVFDFPF